MTTLSTPNITCAWKAAAVIIMHTWFVDVQLIVSPAKTFLMLRHYSPSLKCTAEWGYCQHVTKGCAFMFGYQLWGLPLIPSWQFTPNITSNHNGAVIDSLMSTWHQGMMTTALLWAWVHAFDHVQPVHQSVCASVDGCQIWRMPLVVSIINFMGNSSC